MKTRFRIVRRGKARPTNRFMIKRKIKMKRGIKIKNWGFFVGASLLVGVWSLGFSADWPQWGRQPMRNMYSPAKGLPDNFGKVGFKPGTEDVEVKAVKNLKWAAKIGSQSYGNVTVAAGKVFIGTNNEN